VAALARRHPHRRRAAAVVQSIRRAELDRLEFKLSGLPPEARDEARARLDEITHLLVEKLLLTPTEQLKSLADPETATLYAEAVTRVFGLDETEQKTDSRVEPFRKRPSGRQR
jgi:glutamyl-tRNA reductase